MAEAQIILSHSRESGIVAIASGEQYPWAHTALAESGFQRDDDGVWHLPADGTKTTVVDLIRCAKRHRTSVHTSSSRFIGDAARDLAQPDRARSHPAHRPPGPRRDECIVRYNTPRKRVNDD
ncbi:hypothetical protein [Streptomyces sp. NA02536]|uniref:hypothetical protein n=1 Tax=Streptomyces sp. NA02536 TaxID=2742133 RepID=UPI0020CB0F0C|nr:hypothetical protein [Streptomyces sp. NA02536]